MSLQLGAAGFEVGVITASRSINLILALMIEGKVSSERAKVINSPFFSLLSFSEKMLRLQ